MKIVNICLTMSCLSCGLRQAAITRVDIASEMAGLSPAQQELRIKQLRSELDERKHDVYNTKENMDLAVVVGIFGCGIGALLIYLPEIPFQAMANREIERVYEKKEELDKLEIQLSGGKKDATEASQPPLIFKPQEVPSIPPTYVHPY